MRSDGAGETGRADLVILGAGPAGCMAAIAALRAAPGLDVVLLDPEPKPRHRIGEILLTQTMWELARHGLAPEIAETARQRGWTRKFGFTFVHGTDRTPWVIANNDPAAADGDRDFPAEFTTPAGAWHTFMVPRHEFDQELRRLAVARGARLIPARAAGLRWAGTGADSHILSVDSVAADGARRRWRPGQLIDATGQHAFVSRKMRSRVPLQARARSARYGYFRGVDFDRAQRAGFYREGANILSFSEGWVWIAYLGAGMTSVGVVAESWPEDLTARLAALPEASLFGLDRAEPVDHSGAPRPDGRPYIHPNYSYSSGVAHGRNWVAAGDAAMFLDPLLSQGVTLAIAFGGRAGAHAAAALTGAGDPEPRAAYGALIAAYRAEIAVLERLVELWYRPEPERDGRQWLAAAGRLAHIFGRPIGDDVGAFRWVANMENIHMIMQGGGEADILARIEAVCPRALDQRGADQRGADQREADRGGAESGVGAAS